MKEERLKELLEGVVISLANDNDWRQIKDRVDDITQEELDFLQTHAEYLDRLYDVIEEVTGALIAAYTRLLKEVS